MNIPETDKDLHIWFCFSLGYWKATGCEGDYGISKSRMKAIEIAKDASATAHHGKRRIIVHRPYGEIELVITKTTKKPTSQAYQDDVP